jgi:hypothetical protein
VLVRRYEDFAGCEDAVQEALVAAAQHWAKEGVPNNPRSWLVTAACWAGSSLCYEPGCPGGCCPPESWAFEEG